MQRVIKLDPQEKQIMEKTLLSLSDQEFKQLIDQLQNREKSSRDLLISTLSDSKKLMARLLEKTPPETRQKAMEGFLASNKSSQLKPAHEQNFMVLMNSIGS